VSGCLGTSRGSSSGSSSTTSTTPRIRVPRHVAHLVAPLVVDYFTYVVQLGASARRAARRAARHTAPRRLLRLCRAFGCLGTSRGSSSTTSPTPRFRVRQHVARLVVDYFTYAARPGASARRAAHHATHRRLLRLRRASGCLGTSRGSTSTTSPTSRVWVPWHFAWLVVDYSAHAACPGASAHRAAHRAARRAARRRLLCLRRASGCLGPSRGSSRGSSSTTSPRAGLSSTTSPTSRVRVPRHVARLVVDHAPSRCSTSRQSVALAFAVRPIALSRGSTTPCAATRFVVRSHWLYFSHAMRRDYLSRGNTSSIPSTPCAATTSSSCRIASTFSSRLVFQTCQERQSRPQQLVGINSD
jgi:hypothetical protein